MAAHTFNYLVLRVNFGLTSCEDLAMALHTILGLDKISLITTFQYYIKAWNINIPNVFSHFNIACATIYPTTTIKIHRLILTGKYSYQMLLQGQNGKKLFALHQFKRFLYIQ